MTLSDDAMPVDTIPVADASQPAPRSIIEPSKAIAVAALAALADWLFYRHDIGISAAVFIAALGIAVIVVNPVRASSREQAAAAALLVAGLIPMILQPSLLATMFGIAGVAYAATATTETGMRWSQCLHASARLIFDVTWRAPSDIKQAVRARPPAAWLRPSGLIGWIVPIGLGTLFLTLFASANPLIERFISSINIAALFAQLDIPRMLLWLLIATLVWPFIFMRNSTALDSVRTALAKGGADVQITDLPSALLNRTAILRSLLMFNALFAVQTVLDLTYLWGDAALPAGLTHAAYAHRGAYPLIATALLAAAFVIIALRPGSDAEGSRLIRWLVYGWIAQNVLLVSSSIFRLDLYVEVYSLSYWRLAAGIWMGLVATGLLLIVARITLSRSNSWLVAMNAGALAVTLYAVSLVNLPAVLANYNVEHSREVDGKGLPLDLNYLGDLGPHAIPALDRYKPYAPASVAPRVEHMRTSFAQRHDTYMTDWRAWGVYDAQLASYLRR